VSNYFLPILPSLTQQPLDSTTTEIPRTILYFLDTGGGSYPEILYADQVEFYVNLSTSLATQYGRRICALGFLHIPDWSFTRVQPSDRHSGCFGMSDDGVTPTDVDTGLVPAILKRGDIRAIFVGHDHGNDWCCPYPPNQPSNRVFLCYGRHSGYGGYGDWARGARVIHITAADVGEFTLRSWVRMEDGSVVDSGPLDEP